MAQGTHTYTVTLTSTTLVATTFKLDGLADSDARAQVRYGDTTIDREYNVPGLFSGDVTFTFIPDTAGATSVTQMNTALEAAELFTLTVKQDAVGSESANPSTDNPTVTYTGHIFEHPGGPVNVGEIRQYPLTMSIKTRVVAVA